MSSLIPGEPKDRRTTMADLVCRHEWGWDFDQSQDNYTSSGMYEANNTKCYFVLDNGVREDQTPTFKVYRWDGHNM
jgi:hypothetical protein